MNARAAVKRQAEFFLLGQVNDYARRNRDAQVAEAAQYVRLRNAEPVIRRHSHRRMCRGSPRCLCYKETCDRVRRSARESRPVSRVAKVSRACLAARTRFYPRLFFPLDRVESSTNSSRSSVSRLASKFLEVSAGSEFSVSMRLAKQA